LKKDKELLKKKQKTKVFYNNPLFERLSSTSLFYIYQIEENYARWYELETKEGIIQRERKEKIQQIELQKIEIEL
jgi:hypothetical protein